MKQEELKKQLNNIYQPELQQNWQIQIKEDNIEIRLNGEKEFLMQLKNHFITHGIDKGKIRVAKIKDTTQFTLSITEHDHNKFISIPKFISRPTEIAPIISDEKNNNGSSNTESKLTTQPLKIHPRTFDILQDLIQHFPMQKRAWMLAVDGKFYAQENGPVKFDEREPGCVLKILEGLHLALTMIGKPRTTKDILSIHKTCMQGIESKTTNDAGKIRKNKVTEMLGTGWATARGLKSLVEWTEANPHYEAHLYAIEHQLKDGKFIPFANDKNLKAIFDPRIFIGSNCDFEKLIENFESGKLGLCYIPCDPGKFDIEKELSKILNHYNKKINNCKDINESLELTINTIQSCTRLHPFRNGNNRVFVNDLLPVMLLENGFSLPIFFDPNIFEFHATDEVIAKIMEAIFLTEAMRKSPTMKIFGFDDTLIPKEKIAWISKLGTILLLGFKAAFSLTPKNETSEEKPTQKTQTQAEPSSFSTSSSSKLATTLKTPPTNTTEKMKSIDSQSPANPEKFSNSDMSYFSVENLLATDWCKFFRICKREISNTLTSQASTQTLPISPKEFKQS